MYDQAREAIAFYYCALEVHEQYNEACRGKKKARRPSPPTFDDVYLRYAVRVGDGIVRHEAEALCNKWAPFLISHFDKEEELDWTDTPFAKSLRSSRPDVVKRIADVANGLIPPPPPPPPPETQDSEEEEAPPKRRSRSAKASSRNSEVEDERRSLALGRSRSPPQPKPASKAVPRMIETPVPLPEKYRQFTQPASSKSSPAPVDTPKGTLNEPPMAAGDAESESPVDRLLAVLQEIARDTDLNKAAPSKIHNKVFFMCKIRHYSESKHILAYYAKDLLPRLGVEWKGTLGYNWLKNAAQQPWKPTELTNPENIPAQTLRRAKSVPKQDSSANPATTLPPTINLKAIAKKAVHEESEGDSEDYSSTAAPVRGRMSGKNAGLRLVSSTSQKRPRADLDDQANGGRRGRKSAKLSHQSSDEDEEMEDAEDTSDDDVAAGEEMGVGSRLPLPDGAIRVVVHAERIPTTSPKGPDGTWTCEQEGCAYVVRSADEQDAQELIQAHFRDHEAQADKINLAVKESRGHMPINHLLSKIQALGKAALFRKQETVNGEPVPAPVKRRLLI
ncbi:hypothetical protein NEMBOFW57_005992 [Staphylotrichum longicolle]|uniref:Uncharacterized protein n=1 Tax=Staphylotrichum longicolle TaxID=669026 RepID=A0AAD4I065_9PEZI|nr:hypothetical protein NEMBOFW57_005992 [Staphylotrichum longicolle]